MHCVSGQENALLERKVIADALSDLICRPPVAVLVRELIRMQNLLCCTEDDFGIDLAAIDFASSQIIRRSQLDVQPNKLILTRYDHQRATAGRVNRTPHSNIGKVLYQKKTVGQRHTLLLHQYT